MKKTIIFIIGIILLLSLFAHFNVYADEKTPSCTAGEKELAYKGSSLKISVENLPVGDYELWVYQDTAIWIDKAWISGAQLANPLPSEFEIPIGADWPVYTYLVTINTPGTTLKRRGDVIAKCAFILHPAEDNPGTIIKPIDVTCQNSEGEGVSTALGCIPIKPSGFVNWLLTFSIGIGGGIAFLLMIFGGFQIILSSGNPEKIKAGKEMITAAIGGLLLIIFSVFILRVIGYDILAIPGFGK